MSGRKRNSLTESFVAHSREMRQSVAWHHLPDNARRVLDRLELEHMNHGGAENGGLVVTFDQFAEAGIRRASVALALRQAVALGFLHITFQGGRTKSEFRWPSQYRLTYVVGCGRSPIPTHDWKKLDTPQAATMALTKAAIMKRYDNQPARSKPQLTIRTAA